MSGTSARISVLALALAVVAFAGAPATAGAAEVPEGAKWSETYISSSDGVKLHVDILRPAHLPDDAKTPVILSIGPYFNYSGQVGPVGPAIDASYDPVGPTEGPSDRFYDLVEGAKLMERGYTFVMVDLRGFGGSSGCLDWGGPGETADVVHAVEWAAAQPWSNGKVGMYGKSYDAVTGLIGVNQQPEGLAAVVAQQPVYDLYRYLYGDGLRRFNSVATPALYDLIDLTPGPATDFAKRPEYQVNGANDTERPGCKAGNWADQAADDDHHSNYWRARNLIPGAKGSEVPLFLTAGLPENNTVSDGLAQYMENHTGYERAWLGPWDHVRGNETNSKGELIMGRAGFFDEVMRFYDRFLKGVEPDVEDPPVAVQTYDGTWRGEEVWPPADAVTHTSRLSGGEYHDDGYGFTWGSGAREGIWTFSRPLPHDAHMVGSPRAVLDVSSPKNGNLVVSLYDVDPDGKALLLTRQGHLLRSSGTYTLDLWSLDHEIPAGHRIGVRVADADLNWWLMQTGSHRDLTVHSVAVDLPFLTFDRTETIAGGPSLNLPKYLRRTVTLSPETISEGESDAFVLPPAQRERETGTGAGDAPAAPPAAAPAAPPAAASGGSRPEDTPPREPGATGSSEPGTTGSSIASGRVGGVGHTHRVDMLPLRRALKRGLRIRGNCSETCRTVARLKVSRRDMHRHALRRAVVARGTSGEFTGDSSFRVRFTKEARRKLRNAQRVAVRLVVVTRNEEGERRVLRLRDVLRR